MQPANQELLSRKDPSLSLRMTVGFVVMLSEEKHLFFSAHHRER
jgi:hypothetical protein